MNASMGERWRAFSAGPAARMAGSVAILVAVLVAIGTWVIASPVGAEPDADFHLTSIWCQTAGEDSRCARAYLINGDVAVKTYAAFDVPCFAHYQWRSAACQTVSAATFYTERVNNGDYPAGFYWFMGLLATKRLVASVLAMRLLNVVLFVGLVAVVFWLSDGAVRRAMVKTLAVGLVPVGIFMIASINPSSWAITGISVQFFALLALASSRGRWKPVVLETLAVCGAIMAAAARGDAGGYAVGVSVVAAWLVFPRIVRRPSLWPAFVIPVAIGLLTFFGSRQVSEEVGGSSVREPDAFNLFHILSVPLGNVGPGASLGWLDTPMPPATWAPMVLVLGALIFTEIQGIGWRRGLAAAGAGLATVALPYLMLERGGFTVGEFVQARYVLPLLIVFLGVLTWHDKERGRRPIGLPGLAVVACLAVAESSALYANLLRYVSGFEPYLLGARVEWWWSIPIGPQATWAIGTLAFTSAVFALYCRHVADPRRPHTLLPMAVSQAPDVDAVAR